jgi:hypothetical protein
LISLPEVTTIATNANADESVSLTLQNESGFQYAPEDTVFFLRNTKTGKHLLFTPGKVKKISPLEEEFSGQTKIDGSVFSYQIKIALDKNAPIAFFTPSWKVDRDLIGWEVAFAYQKGFTDSYRAQSYPFAGNSDKVNINPMRYCGIPGVLLYKPDLSNVLFYTIDSRSDYLNPTTWTGKTRFAFIDGAANPCFYACGGEIKAGVNYELPLQLFQDTSEKFETIIPNIVKNWMKTVDYKVEPLFVRTPQKFFDLTVEGRQNASFWFEGKGYKHNQAAPFIYIGNNPCIAYFEYLLYKRTGNRIWRDRAFQQIDFTLKGQLPSGVIHTCYNIKDRGKAGKEGEFVSWCHSHNGYKVDINAWAARYILETWKAVKEHENLDKKEWYDAAIRSLDWALKQQNEDGGFPQCVDMDANGNETKKSQSVVCGRLMDAFPKVAKITGNDIYLKKALEAEKVMREKVENRFWYTGAHPDLPPEDFEQDSVYAVVEYWLDKYDRTGEKDALEHAVANAYYALLYWCPKQLSWVTKPTQCAHSEQQHYNQYSVYNYCNRKIQCLDRLHKAADNPLFEQLKNRVMQLFFATQITEGEYKGSAYEAIADPWLERGANYDFTIDGKRGRNNMYTSELVSDMMIQLIELGLVK